MKTITESSEVFQAYARIDYCYCMLSEITRQCESREHLSTPIERMVDKATGYDKKRMSVFRESAIDLLKEIIESKKIIEVDYSNDEKTLAELTATKP